MPLSTYAGVDRRTGTSGHARRRKSESMPTIVVPLREGSQRMCCFTQARAAQNQRTCWKAIRASFSV